MKQAVFLDQNSVLMRGAEIDTGTAGPLMEIKEKGYLLVVMADQPELSDSDPVKRDLLRDKLDLLHDRIRNELFIDEIFVCPHRPADIYEHLAFRVGLIVQAQCRLGIDVEESFLISGATLDADAALLFKCRPLLIESKWIEERHKSLVVPNLRYAALTIPWIIDHGEDTVVDSFLKRWKDL